MPAKIKRRLSIVILDFDDVANPLLGAGQAKATYELAKRLVKRGHKVEVISSRYPGYKDRMEQGIRYRHIGISSGNIRLNNLIYILAVPWQVMKVRADVVVECFTAPISTLLSPLFTKLPVVVIPSSFEADRFAKRYHLPVNLIEKWGIRFYRYALPYSKAIEGKFLRLNPKMVCKIVPEGVDVNAFKMKPGRAKHILFLGRMDMDQKGLDLLLKAYKKIAGKCKYPLVMVGFGPDEDRVKELVEKLKLTNKVSLVGPSYGEDKLKLMRESRVIVLPSRDETFSCFALEALASGHTLATFDIPGLSWLDDDQVVVKAKPYSVNEYAKKLLMLVKDPRLAAKNKRAREFAKKFSWEKMTRDYETFFYKVVAERN